MNLKPCPLCDAAVREIHAEDFHQSFVIYSKGGEVEFNLLHFGALQCVKCGLTLPFHDEGENRIENLEFWNANA